MKLEAQLVTTWKITSSQPELSFLFHAKGEWMTGAPHSVPRDSCSSALEGFKKLSQLLLRRD